MSSFSINSMLLQILVLRLPEVKIQEIPSEEPKNNVEVNTLPRMDIVPFVPPLFVCTIEPLNNEEEPHFKI